MLVLKLVYFCSAFAASSGPLNLAIYLEKALHLSKEQVGLVCSVVPFVDFIDVD